MRPIVEPYSPIYPSRRERRRNEGESLVMMIVIAAAMAAALYACNPWRIAVDAAVASMTQE